VKKIIITILIFVILATVVYFGFFFDCGGCETIADLPPGDEVAEVTPTFGGEIRLAMTPLNIWCPLSAQSESHIQMFNLIFDSLITVEANMTPIPNLATSWVVSDDARVWTLALNRSARWHNEEPFTAYDVQFTINTIRGRRQNSIYYQNIQNISRVDVLDYHTVEFTLLQPRANFINTLYFPIIRRQAGTHNPQTFEPIGTGAFIFAPPEQGNLILTKNSAWHNGSIYVDRVNVSMVSTNQNLFMFSGQQLDMLISHDINWGRNVSTAIVRYANVPTNRFTFLGFNHSNRLLRELHVREAIAHSIDYRGLVQNVLHHRAIPSFTPISPNWTLYNSANPTPEFNPELARQILFDNGWELGEDGIFIRRVGWQTERMQFDILINNDNPLRGQVASFIQNSLRGSGIAVNVVSVTFDQYSSRLGWGGFDMFIGEYNVFADLDFDFMLGRNNTFRMRDYELEQLLDDVRIQTNSSDTETAYFELQSYVIETIPMIGLYYKNATLLYNPQIKGSPSPTFHNIYRGVNNLWVSE